MREYVVDQEVDLISYLKGKKIGKNKVKSLVKYGKIFVNESCVMKLPCVLKIGDVLKIEYSSCSDFKIVYEDNNYLVVDKEAGLLTISSSSKNKSFEDTLYKKVRSYLNSKKEYAFIVNRIDRETSGLVIFAKNENFKMKLQEAWNDIVLERKYIALVSGIIKSNGRIDNYLYEDKRTFSHSTKIGGKRAITNYRVIKTVDKYSLLDINIETGRKNQIRVHMTEMNHPIVGDKKYYSKDNRFKRLMLHHYQISLIDPVTKKKMTFTSPIPCEFDEIFYNS